MDGSDWIIFLLLISIVAFCVWVYGGYSNGYDDGYKQAQYDDHVSDLEDPAESELPEQEPDASAVKCRTWRGHH